jgi:hypothetical protein
LCDARVCCFGGRWTVEVIGSLTVGSAGAVVVPTASGPLLVREVIGDESPSSEVVAANEQHGYSDRGDDADSTPNGDRSLRGHRRTLSMTL